MACPIRKGVIVLEFLLLSACASVRPAPSSPVSSELSDLSTLSLSSLDNDSNPGCLSMVNQFCTSLYEPGKDGNLVIQTKKGKAISILQGKTENDLNQVFFELSKSKIKHQKELPSDFLSILRAHSYFKKLDDLLRRKPRATMNLTDRVESLEQEAELDSLWNISIQDTLLIRTTDKFPNFPEMKDELIPPEIVHFQRQEKKVILSEISRAIWKNHRNWARVNSTFEDLRKAYLKVIDRLHVLPRIKSDWADRIKSLRLVPPGSLPAIADQECASTTMNAYYYPQLNVLTICAGDFNSEESLSTLAHEMSHALDLNRSLFIYFKESEFSQILHEVNRGFCGTNAIHYSCDKWEQFKKGLDPHMVELSHFTADVPEFNRCLKREHTKPLDRRFIARHPAAALYGNFHDFQIYRMRIERAHLIAGFGRIHWIDATEVIYPARTEWLHDSEAGALEHMNKDHAASIDLYAQNLLELAGSGWSLTGIDPEGADLRRSGSVARLTFPAPVENLDAVRHVFAALAQSAKRGAMSQ